LQYAYILFSSHVMLIGHHYVIAMYTMLRACVWWRCINYLIRLQLLIYICSRFVEMKYTMFREISTKSGISSKRREILHFSRNVLCLAPAAPRAPLAPRFARLRRSFGALCGARLTRLCSRLRRLDLSRTTFRNFPAPLHASAKFSDICVISRNTSLISHVCRST